MALIDEIREQPEVLQRWLDTSLDVVREIADVVRQRDVQYVFLAARGTSDHAGVYAQYLLGSRNRLPVALAAPSLFTMYPESPRLDNALVVGISQSGQSPDIVGVIDEGRRQGAITLAITNHADSPMSRAAKLNLDIGAGQELAVAATKTYTAQLMALAALSVALDGNRLEDLEAMYRVPGAVEAALALDAEAERIATRHAALGQCVVLGRGYNYATAQEWALKLKELAYVFTDVYSTADFQHGPIAIVEEGFPILAVAPEGAVFSDMVSLLRRLRDEYKAELVVISDSDEALSLAHDGLCLPGGLPEWLTPIPAIVPGQLFCYHLTRAKGLDTEQPRTLRKVTLTQ
ncbi:MAG TPA: SIS domain-containing protein [Chloroflexia bacterium]|jgi:glucosamine--fructose-6-phosphate aminotransferase (isomerizing)